MGGYGPSEITLHLKWLVSSQIVAGRTLNAVSDGAFAATPLNAQDRTAKHSMRN